MGFGVGYGSTPGAVVGNIAGMKTLTSTVNLVDGWNTITHNLGANYRVVAWFAEEAVTGIGIDVNPPATKSANSFTALVGGTYTGATVLVMYKHI